MKAFWTIMVSLLLGTTGAMALQKNIKMGKPTSEELALTTFEEDPDAEAICLYHGTDVQFRISDEGIKADYYYKVRIKVLKPEGTNWGNTEILYRKSSKSPVRESVVGIKGAAYNLEDGKVVKSKLNGDLKNDEMVNNYLRCCKFSIPNVKVGTVLEYEYKIESDFFYQIRDWYAQKSIPVVYTDFVITIPEFLQFGKLQTGAYTIHHKFTDTNYAYQDRVGRAILNAVQEEYWAENMPKMVKEDYIHNIDDYKSRVIYDLKQICFRGRPATHYNNSWHDVDKMLLEDEDYGELCKMKNPMPEFGVFLKTSDLDIKKIEKNNGDIIILDLSNSPTVKDKVNIMRNVLRKKLKWNGSYGIYGKSVRQLVKEPTANSAALNFALMAFLRDAGIESVPVVLSRRSNGRLNTTHANISALNAMVLQVQDGDNFFYVDAANEEYPVSVLPAELLVENARVISHDRFQWVDISKCCKANLMHFVDATLQEDGTLSGMLMRRQRGLLAGIGRKGYVNKKDSLTYVENMAARLECDITDYRVGDMSINTDAFCDSIFFSKQVDSDGESIYINPYLFTELKSPFKSDTRDLPIECDCMENEKHTIKIRIPEGYAAEETPKPIVVRLEDGKTTCKIITGISATEINISITYNRDTMFYNASEFPTLRTFWSTIEDCCNTILVLKKQS